MSLILSSAIAPQAAKTPATSRAGRSDAQERNGPDSFGAVLKRSQTSTEPDKTAKKTAEPRHQRIQSSDKQAEQLDPAAALALAFIALEPRIAAVPAGTAASGPASTVAVALGTDTGLNIAQGAQATLSQSGPELPVPQLTLATSDRQDGDTPVLPNYAAVVGKADATTSAGLTTLPQPALAPPDRQDGDTPVLSANAIAETSAGFSAPQLAAASRDGLAQAALPAKDAAAEVSAAVTLELEKIADQVVMPDTRSSGPQPKQDDTATDSRDGKFNVKTELRHAEAPVSASIVDASAASKENTVDTDQFSLSATPINQAGVLPQPPAGAVQQAASLPLTAPVGSSEWGDALGKQMVWMGNSNHQVAELQLNPDGLGPLKITLTINNHQAEALFVSAHPSVRAAVEAALPQLRANLADNGISLGNTSVSADTQQQSAFGQDQASQSSQRSANSASVPNPAAELGLPVAAPAVAGNRNKVDTFA